MQSKPSSFVPVRKSEEELKAERAAELERQLEYLHNDPGIVEWGKKFPERLKEDIERAEKELSKLKVGKPPKEKPLGKEVKPKKSKK